MYTQHIMLLAIFITCLIQDHKTISVADIPGKIKIYIAQWYLLTHEPASEIQWVINTKFVVSIIYYIILQSELQAFYLICVDASGLIDGAHEDKGLGHEFLKHVERTKVLLYVVDAAGNDGREPSSDLTSLVRELKLYNETLLSKPSLVFLNKSDIRGMEVVLPYTVSLLCTLFEDMTVISETKYTIPYRA